jgi:hypothetical protein
MPIEWKPPSVWSQDKDFSATGVEVVTTGELLDSLRAEGHHLE